MAIDDYRKKLEKMQADFATLKESDLEIFSVCAGAAALSLRGALWNPHARADGLALAAEFEALERMAEKRLLEVW